MPNLATSTSPTSKVLHRLGCLIIGTPKSLQVDPDFYREKGDRDLPTAKEIQEHKVQRNRVAQDAYRRDVTARIGWLTCFAAIAVCLVGYGTLGTASAVRHKWTEHSNHAAACATYAQSQNHLPLPDDCK